MNCLIRLSRAELKKHKAEEYLDGTVIAVNRYRIFVKYGVYSLPLKTTVSVKGDLRDMPLHKLPYYILDFI